MRKRIILLHIFGLSMLTTSAIFMTLSFYLMHVQGRAIFYEDNYYIRYAEFSISMYGVLYALYLLAEFVWKYTPYRADDDTVSN